MNKRLMMLVAAFSLGTACAQKARYTSQDNAQFAQTIAQQGVQLVDVRTPQEYQTGRLPGAVNIDVRSEQFATQAATLDKTRPVALYCRSGARSKTAANLLAEQGFTVYELDKGIAAWNGAITP